MAHSVKYTGITPEIYSALKSKLDSYGIKLEGNMGRASEKGVSADYNYDETNQTLSIDNLKVGFPASMMTNEEKVIAMISGAVTSAGGQVQTA